MVRATSRETWMYRFWLAAGTEQWIEFLIYLQALPYFGSFTGDCKVTVWTPNWRCCRNPWQSRHDWSTFTIWWWWQRVVEGDNWGQPTLGLISNRILEYQLNRQITFHPENTSNKPENTQVYEASHPYSYHSDASSAVICKCSVHVWVSPILHVHLWGMCNLQLDNQFKLGLLFLLIIASLVGLLMIQAFGETSPVSCIGMVEPTLINHCRGLTKLYHNKSMSPSQFLSDMLVEFAFAVHADYFAEIIGSVSLQIVSQTPEMSSRMSVFSMNGGTWRSF